jgi:hypothetical protein
VKQSLRRPSAAPIASSIALGLLCDAHDLEMKAGGAPARIFGDEASVVTDADGFLAPPMQENRPADRE